MKKEDFAPDSQIVVPNASQEMDVLTKPSFSLSQKFGLGTELNRKDFLTGTARKFVAFNLLGWNANPSFAWNVEEANCSQNLSQSSNSIKGGSGQEPKIFGPSLSRYGILKENSASRYCTYFTNEVRTNPTPECLDLPIPISSRSKMC